MSVMAMQPGNLSRGARGPSESINWPFGHNHTLGSDSVVVLPRNYSDIFYNEHQRLTRAPQYRNSRTGGTRSTRTQIDHDLLEGLPIRRWQKRPINVTTAPEKENTNDTKARNLAWPELEMPRDHHLLSEMSQNLLRAARMPQAQKSIIAPLMEDDKETAEDEDVDGDVDSGFIAKRWALVPKDLEGPEPEFLAKRRRGLPPIHGEALAALGTTQQMRKTKIRKLDASGGSSILEVLVPEGQAVDGEIFEDETSPTQAPAPGTVVEGVGVANAEGVVIAGDPVVAANNKKRPPPPKRKSKAPNKGRKKKVAFTGADGKPTSRDTSNTPNGMIGIGEDQIIDGEQGPHDQSGAVVDESQLQEGEEGSEEGSEGEEGEEGQREEGELSTSPSPPPSPSTVPHTVVIEPEIDPEDTLITDINPPPEISITTSIAGESPVESTTEPHTLQTSQPNLEVTKKEADDAISGKATDEPFNEPVNDLNQEAIAQPNTEGTADPTTETSLDLVGQKVDELEKPIEPQPQPYPNIIVEDALVETVQPITENPVTRGSRESPQDIAIASITDAVPQPETQGIDYSEAERIPSISIQAIPEEDTETPLKAEYEPPLEPDGDILMESNSNAPEDPDTDAIEQPVVEFTSAVVKESLLQEPHDQSTDSMPFPILEPTEQTSPVAATESFAMPAAQAQEEVAAFPVEDSAAGPPPDPAPPRIAEVYYEHPTESTERRFSLTRPTASPKAPTPSPPTPIEEKFSLPTSYVSPKAPTMSPPTPIDRSMLSSPDIPLAEQQFELPPAIDAVRERVVALGPDKQYIPSAARLSVEAAPRASPQVAAQIPVDHDPLDGLAAPEVSNDPSEGRGTNEKAVQFSDGEEDLLGSLERSLDQRSRT